MIPALSFRIKLLLSMLLVVVGVTGATLYISQRSFQRFARKFFSESFERQAKRFLEIRDLLLKNTSQTCGELVKLPRIQEAFSSALESGEAEKLYSRIRDELLARRVIAEYSSELGPFKAAFVLCLDAKGEIIPPPTNAFPGFKALANQPRLKHQLSMVGDALPKMEAPIVGYVTPETEDGRLDLQQAIFTKIIDRISGDTLGSLALGFPLPELADKTGILFENHLYSSSLPIDRRDGLGKRVSEEIKISTQPPEDFIEVIDDDPHRIFYQTLNTDAHFPKASLVALVSVKEALAHQRDLRGKIFIFGGVGLAGAIVFSLLLSHGFSGPIEELVKGTAEIRGGNFTVQVPVRSRDEIGRLAESFNEMAGGLALKEKYRSVLDKVADQAVAQELLRGNVQLGGEAREISVLFCDIRGFTPLTQGMDPAEVIYMLNEHFTPLTRVVKEHRGFVDKFVGDLIMAVFGAPKSYGNDAYNAARCALDMIRNRQHLNEISKYKINIGIGVASGLALAGNMGSSDRLNYTVLGERVNLASRLCGKAGRMDVVIDETTYQRLSGLAVTETLTDLELKGFSARVQAYKLSDLRPLQTDV